MDYLARCGLTSANFTTTHRSGVGSLARALPRAILKLLTILVLIGAIQARANFSDDKWTFHAPDGKAYTFKRAGKTRGSPLIRLEDIAREFHLKVGYNAETFQVEVLNPKNSKKVFFHTYAKSVAGEGFETELSRAPEFVGAQLAVPLDFGDRALRPLLTGEPPLLPKTPIRSEEIQVVIDPGHGGNDSGTSFKVGPHSYLEKDITLQAARELKRLLEEKHLSVVLTRDNDAYLSLPERTKIANAFVPKFFVSLHVNSAPNPKTGGFELYVLSLKNQDHEARSAIATENQMIPDALPEGQDRALADLRAESNFESSLALAKSVTTSLVKAASPSQKKPIRTGPFYVLYGSESPGILVELGYLNFSNDRVRMLSESARAPFLRQLAEGLANAAKTGIVVKP